MFESLNQRFGVSLAGVRSLGQEAALGEAASHTKGSEDF